MIVESLEVLLCTVIFVVPGFVLCGVRDSLVPRKDEKIERSFLRYLQFSILNDAIWFPVIWSWRDLQLLEQYPTRFLVACLAVLFVSPTVLGLLLGMIQQKSLLRPVLRRFKLNLIHTTPNSWDYKFSTTSPTWVQIWLKDGKRVIGLFGASSFASSDPNERDVYIESVYVLKNGKWSLPKRQLSALIKGDQILYVEFLGDERRQEDGRTTNEVRAGSSNRSDPPA